MGGKVLRRQSIEAEGKKRGEMGGAGGTEKTEGETEGKKRVEKGRNK